MPFWWRRRRRPWFFKYRKTRRNTYRRKKKRPYRRRRFRPAPRRRRRHRRRRVRRKRKLINIKQWQPDSIVTCKIKGHDTFLLGAEGRQYTSYTSTREDYIPPKSPGGGAFAAIVFSLSYLYDQYVFRKNIWTKSNIFKDLCRYIRCKFTIYRHPETDLIFSYERQPPFNLNKFQYTATHPMQLLLSKHRRILLSTLTNPKGKVSKTVYIKPPKQMLTKWFFTDSFCKYSLLLLKGAACNFRHPSINPLSQSTQVNIYYLNPTFYANTGWGYYAAETSPYKPNTMKVPFKYTYKDGKETKETTFQQPTSYIQSVSYEKGWFTPSLLNAISVGDPPQDALPILVGRYIPEKDNGVGNKIYWVSVVKATPIEPTDEDLKYYNLPLWLMLWGYIPYIQEKKLDKTFLQTHYLVIECSAIHIFKASSPINKFIIVDENFINGNPPYNEYLTQTSKTRWYPQFEHQLETINTLIESGPLVPKLSNIRYSNWEFDYSYCFTFKWGGPQITDQEVKDPATMGDYDVPDHLQGTVQITNPEKQTAPSILHPWDYRRGFVTQTALKRMCEHIETDTDFYPDAEAPKKKKRARYTLQVPEEETQEIQKCVLSLCEEPTCQDQENQTLLHLIQQQQQQQFQLKRNLLTILSEMKEKQRMLQLQTGILE